MIVQNSPQSPVIVAPAFGAGARLVWEGACALVAGLLFVAYLTPYTIDDPWITYRYSENLAHGEGFVFNAGERVLGTSTPLYTLLLAATSLLGLPVPETSQALGLLAMFGILIGLYQLMRELHSELAGLLAVSLLVSFEYFHRVVTYGMETPLYTLCIVWAFHAYAVGRLYRATVLAALCLLFRLDGMAVGAALVLAYVVRERRLPWKLLPLYLGLVAPWFVFSYVYFGSLVPHSFLAKRFHSDGLHVSWMIKWLATVASTPVAALGGFLCLRPGPLRDRGLPFALWSAAYIVAYSLSQLYGHDWYHTPLLPGLAGLATLAALALGVMARRRTSHGALLSVALIVLLIAIDGGLPKGLGRLASGAHDALDDIERTRFEAAHWIEANLPVEQSLVTGGIGHVGYFGHRYLVDASGLITPRVVKANLPEAWPRFLGYIVEHDHPRYVFDAFKHVPPYMVDDYQVVKRWETGSWVGPFLLLERKSRGAASAGAHKVL